MPKHNKKYKQLISTSKELFWKFGIKRVTVEEICDKAGVSKMTFYKFFTNKTELVKQIIDNLFEDSMEKYRAIMDDNSRVYKDKITDMTILKMEATNNISHEFVHDYYNYMDQELDGYMQKLTQQSLQVMLQDFRTAQAKGELRKDIKPEFMMYFLNNLQKMADDSQLNALYPNAQDMIIELMNFFFYGVLPRDKSPSTSSGTKGSEGVRE